MTNSELLGPGVSFKELAQKGQRVPEDYRAQRYGVMMYGVDLCDAFPATAQLFGGLICGLCYIDA